MQQTQLKQLAGGRAEDFRKKSPERSLKMKYSMAKTFNFVTIFLLGYGFGIFSPPRRPGETFMMERENVSKLQPPPHDLYRFRRECAPPLPVPEIYPMLISKIYNNVTPYHNFPSPHMAPVLRRVRVRGWGSYSTIFEELIRTTKPKIIIEVGTFLGASALHMANLTRDLDTLILCLDDFRGWPGFREIKNRMFRHLVDVNGEVILMQQFMHNVVEAGEETRIVPVPFSTASGLAALCEWGVYGDLVEVDAGHDFHSAWTDINMAWALVEHGGVMFGHDYNLAVDDHGVRRAVNLFATLQGLKLRPRGQHWVLPRKP